MKKRPHNSSSAAGMTPEQEVLYATIDQMFTYANPLSKVQHGESRYAGAVLVLFQHLQPNLTLEKMEDLVIEALEQQEMSDASTFPEESRLLIHVLVEDLFDLWRTSLNSNKHSPKSFSPSRAGQLMRNQSSTSPQGKAMEHVDDAAPAMPIYDALTQAFRQWNVLGRKKPHEFTFEPLVVWLIQHLPGVRNRDDVEQLVAELFAKQKGATTFAPDEMLLMQFLADDVWSAWSRYQQRHNTSNCAHTRARTRMRQQYLPMRNRR